MKIARICMICYLCVIGAMVSLQAQLKRSIEPKDCVTVRYLSEESHHPTIQISPRGDLVSYEVKTPNLDTNLNDIELYVAHLRNATTQEPRLIVSGRQISAVQWLQDGEHLLALSNGQKHLALVKIDIATGSQEVLFETNADIQEYAVDQRMNTIAYAIDDVSSDTSLNPDQISNGYRIEFHKNMSARWNWPSRKVFVVKRNGGSKWSMPRQIMATSPFSKQTVKTFTYVPTSSLRLSLSPNGKLLLISYLTNDDIPLEWRKSKTARKIDPGMPTLLLILHDLSTGETRMPIDTYMPMNIPLWATDSKSFVIVAGSPVKSGWEQNDLLHPSDLAHLFWVEPSSNKVELIGLHVANTAEAPLIWSSNNDLEVHVDADTIVTFAHKNEDWVEKASVRLPLDHFFRFGQLISNGEVIVGDYQSATRPPEIFAYRPGAKEMITVGALNPQLTGLAMASLESVTWKTSTGEEIEGALLRPPNYVAGRKYPLVIQANLYQGQFLCDSGVTHYPSFAPGPIADAGIMYLMRTLPSESEGPRSDSLLKNYPGGVGEAAFNMDVWDSAIDMLSSKGLIDRNDVGIIGFSRYGWYTEFILANSKMHYRAATATDNVQYNLSEYWLNGEASIPGFDQMYGGPPYAATLQNWIKYSISFNLDRFHTPLLMEVMGYGERHKSSDLASNLSRYLEVFTGLNRLKKPVEMYYYPDEGHQPDHPRSRLASLQRNLDWYRFWLQGYERPNPEDPDQYKRWEHLRELQDADTKATEKAQGTQ